MVSAAIERLLVEMRNNPAGVRFAEAVKVCEHYFGKARRNGSHHVFKMPWAGDPRINLQEDKSGKAKAYQVRQILRAVDALMVVRRRRAEAEDESDG
jgi:hypothetical protein